MFRRVFCCCFLSNVLFIFVSCTKLRKFPQHRVFSPAATASPLQRTTAAGATFWPRDFLNPFLHALNLFPLHCPLADTLSFPTLSSVKSFGVFSGFPFYYFYAQIKNWHQNRADGNPASGTMKRWYWGWRVPEMHQKMFSFSVDTCQCRSSHGKPHRMRRDNSGGWGEEGSTQRGLLAGLADSVEEREEQSRIEWLKTVECGVGEKVEGRETFLHFQALSR